MRNLLHFITKPEAPIMTRKERIENQKLYERWTRELKQYFCAFMLIPLFILFFREDPDSVKTLHQEICQIQPKSPLCTDIRSLEILNTIATRKWVPTRLMLWIYNAESSLWINFNKKECYAYYNWAGLKGKMDDSGKVTMYATNRKKPDKNGCWLYRFSSWEEAVNSLANTLSIGYRACKMKTRCIAYDYVWKPDIAEESWIRNVEIFYK